MFCIFIFGSFGFFCPSRAPGDTAGKNNQKRNEELISECVLIIVELRQKVNFKCVKYGPLFSSNLDKKILCKHAA